MPKINVYLSDELSEAVRDAGIPVSAICQRALEQAVSRITAIRESMVGDGAVLRSRPRRPQWAVQPVHRPGPHGRRARDERRGPNGRADVNRTPARRHAGRRRRSCAVRPRCRWRSSRRRSQRSWRHGDPPYAAAVGAASFDATAQEALRLTMTESASLGHNYVGTEHLLLGLVAEPDGLAGQVLRGLGAELRLTRRAVAGAIAGYASLQANSAAKTWSDPPPSPRCCRR